MARSQQSEPVKRQPVTTHITPVLIIAILALGLLGLYWGLNQFNGHHNPTHGTGVGKSLSFLRLLPLTGDARPVSLDDLKGHVVLLNFWGTWCPPCRDELPHIAELRKRFAGQKDFRLLAVSCPLAGWDGDVKSLREETAGLLDHLGLDLPTYYDPDSATANELSTLMDMESFPTTILLDRNGVIRAVWVGYHPGAETEMERYIGMYLEKDATPPDDRQGT